MANTTTLTAPGQQAGLNDWLDYIGKIHEKPMDLGLERMKDMIARMGIEFTCPVFTVAGTNGKGSTCALLESVCVTRDIAWVCIRLRICCVLTNVA